MFLVVECILGLSSDGRGTVPVDWCYWWSSMRAPSVLRNVDTIWLPTHYRVV